MTRLRRGVDEPRFHATSNNVMARGGGAEQVVVVRTYDRCGEG